MQHGVGRGGKFPPFQGKVLAIERMGGRDAERDVSRIVIETGVSLHWVDVSFGKRGCRPAAHPVRLCLPG